MRIYLSPQDNDKEQTIKYKGEIIQVTVDNARYIYDFSKLTDGEMTHTTGHITSAKRIKGELSLVITNYVNENATVEELFPQWQTIDRRDELDANAKIVPIEWITKEELEAIENAPKPLSEIEKLRLEQAQANSELVQLIMMMGGA